MSSEEFRDKFNVDFHTSVSLRAQKMPDENMMVDEIDGNVHSGFGGLEDEPRKETLALDINQLSLADKRGIPPSHHLHHSFNTASPSPLFTSPQMHGSAFEPSFPQFEPLVGGGSSQQQASYFNIYEPTERENTSLSNIYVGPTTSLTGASSSDRHVNSPPTFRQSQNSYASLPHTNS